MLYTALADGDMAIIRPPPSKADPFGLCWGPNPIWLPYRKHDPINAARELARLEVHTFVCSTSGARKNTPMFVGAKGAAIGKAAVNQQFKQLVEQIAPAGTASRYSVHSFHIYLATTLAAAGASDKHIQAMLQWASEDALMLYKCTDMDEYMLWVGVSGTTSFEMMQSQHLPWQDAGAARDAARAADICR